MAFASSSRLVINAIASSSSGRLAGSFTPLPSLFSARRVSLSCPSLQSPKGTGPDRPSTSPSPPKGRKPPLFPPGYFSSLDNSDEGFFSLLAKVQSISPDDLSISLSGPEGPSRHRFLVNTLTHASHYDHALARSDYFKKVDSRLYPRDPDVPNEAEMDQAREHVRDGTYAEQDKGVETREVWEKRNEGVLRKRFEEVMRSEGLQAAQTNKQKMVKRARKERRKFLARLAVRAELEERKQEGIASSQGDEV